MWCQAVFQTSGLVYVAVVSQGYFPPDSVSPPDFNHAHPPSRGCWVSVGNILPFHGSAQVLPAGNQMKTAASSERSTMTLQ